MSLVSQWKLNEVNGVAAVDSVGSNDGTWDSADLVTNGAFTTDTSWDKGTGWTIDAGDNNVALKAAGTEASVKQNISSILGREYTVKWDLKTRTAGSIRVKLGTADFGTPTTVPADNISEVILHDSLPDDSVLYMLGDSAFAGSIDNVSVKQNIFNDGRGIVFNGTDEYIDIGDTSINVKTVVIIVKLNDVAGNEYPIDLDGASYLSIESGVVTVNGFTAPILYIDGILAVSGVSTIQAGREYQIAITDTTLVDANDMDIGRVTAAYFEGTISDVRIYDTALTSAQIKQLYQSYFGYRVRYSNIKGTPPLTMRQRFNRRN